MSFGQSPRSSRRIRLTRLEERALFDATPLGAVAVVAPNTATADDPADPATNGHGAGCTCESCTRFVGPDGSEGWAIPPVYGSSGVTTKAPPYPTSQTFLLHSRPAATRKIHLDFDGHSTTNGSWNGGATIVSEPFDMNGNGSTWSDAEHERIQKIWQRVMEDFSPFDVDVTTEDPGTAGLTYSGTGDTTWGVRCIISPTDDWYPNAGGVAYVGTFRRQSSNELPCFVFPARLGPNDEKFIAEATSHEVGHTLGMGHDGTASVGYYTGHTGSGGPGWAPIMGVGYYQPVVQWSKGEYSGANNTQDDLAIITGGNNGTPYRPDDAGNAFGSATAATVNGTALTAAGVIERGTDVDVWSFTSGAGSVSFTFSPWVNSPNLDIRAQLLDSTGAVLATSNPTATLNASISFTLPSQGTYYVSVEGVGLGTASNGFTDYASLGQYTITGTLVTGSRLSGLETTALSYTENQGSLALTSALAVSAGADLNQATVTISNYVSGQDVLQFTNQGGITGNFNTGTGVLTLSGTASPATYQTALRSITYTNPSENPSTLTRSFGFQVRDTANNLSPTVSRNMNVTSVNDAPIADAESYGTGEDSPLSIPAASGVLNGDTDVDNATLTAVLVDNVQHGTLTLNANGSFTYTPALNYNGPDSFTYRASDGSAQSNTATVAFNVTAVNDAPVADADNYAVDEEGLLSVPAPTGVLNGDSDVEGSALTAALVSTVQHGTLTFNSDGSFSYTPAPNYSGLDSFTYKANDGALDSAAATVTLTVNPFNDAPVADDDSYTTTEDIPLTQSAAAGVLIGDTDIENSPLTAILVTNVQHGTLTLNPDGSFAYVPTPNYDGPDSFTYKATDGGLESNVATVSLTVAAVNDVPVADNEAYTMAEDGVLNVPAATGVLAGDTDVEGTPLTAVPVSGVQHGTLTLNADGSFDYTPAAHYNGTDSFTYRASDGSAQSNLATVTLTITSVNDVPVAQPDSYTIAEDGTLTVPGPGVRANDSDADGDPLTAIKVSDPANGTVVLNGGGSFTYTPVANYFGPDSFTYKLNDGTADSNTVTVSLTVTAVNDAPIVTGEGYPTNEDTPLAIGAPGLLGNDSDIEGSAITLIPATGPAHGTLTLNADGSFNYNPDANYFGPDSFTYTVSDGTASSTPVTVALSVASVNDAPTAADDTASVLLKKSVTIRVLQNDADLEGGQLTIQSFTQPTKGALTRSGGNFIYTATGPLAGADSFTYTVTDPLGLTATATVNLTLTDPVVPGLSAVRVRYGTASPAVANLKVMSRSVLPWENVNRFELAFTEDVLPAAGSLTLTGSAGTVPLTLGTVPVGGTRTAVWDLAGLTPGTYTLRLSGASVLDINGNAVPGDYVRTFGILPGDFDGNGLVDNRDLKGIKKKYQSNPAKADRFADINGDGLVNVLDYNTAQAALGSRVGP
jgi:VCBS repeat-containing protein